MYAVEKRITLNGYGNTTFRKEAKQRGLEPDECYGLGKLGEVPDIAIEIAIKSGGVDKLSVYQELGVTEVWFWQNDRIYLISSDGRNISTERTQRIFARFRFIFAF